MTVYHGSEMSANGVGLTYEDGQRDSAEAFHWYLEAAEMRFGEASYNVCRMAAQGLGIAADYPEAIKWCSKLADSGDEWGQFGMGRIYEDGTGVPPDPVKAFQVAEVSRTGEPRLHNLAWELCTRMAKAFDAI
jgi:TPR repeat protein